MKKYITLILMAIATLLCACGPKEPPVVAVQSVTLSSTSLNLTEGDSQPLTATVAPSNATDASVSWSTSNASVATVNAGTVSAVAPGSATITARAGDKSATCAVTVVARVYPVESVTLSPTSLNLTEGDSQSLTATVSPSNATDPTVSWSTSDASVATVDAGTVTAVKPGSATITARAGDKSATCDVTVVARVYPVVSVSLDPTEKTIKVGDNFNLTFTIQPENATNKEVTWSSSAPTIASVENGVVTGVAPGEAVITVTTVDGSHTATCAVKVTAPVIILVYDSAEWGDMWFQCAIQSTGEINADFPGVHAQTQMEFYGNKYYAFEVDAHWFPEGELLCMFNDGSNKYSQTYLIEVESGDVLFLEMTSEKDSEGDYIAAPIEDPEHFTPSTPPGTEPTPGPANAIFWENFDSGTSWESQWTFIDLDGDGHNWVSAVSVMGSGSGHNGSYNMLLSQSYINDVGVLYPDNWAFTPAITLTAGYNSVSCWMCAQDASYPSEHYGIYVTDVVPGTEGWRDHCVQLVEGTMTASIPPSDTPRVGLKAQGNWYNKICEIPNSFNGKTVYVGFRHFNCSDNFYLNLDDVAVISESGSSSAPSASVTSQSVLRLAPSHPFRVRQTPKTVGPETFRKR